MKLDWLIDLRGRLTQEQVAILAGISRSAYANIEAGKRNPSVTAAKKIAAALKFDWKIFFDDRFPKSKQKSA